MATTNAMLLRRQRSAMARGGSRAHTIPVETPTIIDTLGCSFARARREECPVSITDVVSAGACVGCGACSVITSGQIPMQMNRFGMWEANVSSVPQRARELGSRVCPFADDSPNETVIAAENYVDLPEHPLVGRHLDAFAAQVTDDEYLEGSSSGGMTSWLLLQLLERGLIDGVLHVGPGNGDPLFAYVVSHSPEELKARRKSVYFSTSMAEAIQSIRGNGKRYALVGVPCFITAGRLLARNDDELRTQLCYFVGLVCGHLKSSAFAKLLAWQLGIPPENSLPWISGLRIHMPTLAATTSLAPQSRGRCARRQRQACSAATGGSRSSSRTPATTATTCLQRQQT